MDIVCVETNKGVKWDGRRTIHLYSGVTKDVNL